MVVAIVYLMEIKMTAVWEFDLQAKGQESHFIKF